MAASMTIRPFIRAAPLRYGGLVTGAMALLKLNRAPGWTMVPSIVRAGSLMLTPLPLEGPGAKRVVH
jgi:hypothetical protein